MIGFLLTPTQASKTLARTKFKQAFAWKGEYFQKNVGGIYFYLNLNRYGREQNYVMSRPLRVHLYHYQSKSKYVIIQSTSKSRVPQNTQVWKLPAGKYYISSIYFVNSNNVRQRWDTSKLPQSKRNFKVSGANISNLGQWTLHSKGRSVFTTSFKMSYRDIPAINQADTVNQIINGFTGKVQKQLKQNETLHEKNTEILSQSTGVRNISLTWSINLFKDRSYSGTFSQIISSHSPYLRRCYTNLLDDHGNVNGTLTYAFLISKKSGVMKKLRLINRGVNIPEFHDCVKEELAQMQFSVNRNIIGKVALKFAAFYR